MAFKEFVKASFRTVLAIFLAGIGLIVAVALFLAAKNAYDKHQATPYESIREWREDLKDGLGLQVLAKTKVIAGKLFVAIEIDGYPPYLWIGETLTHSFSLSSSIETGSRFLLGR